MSDQAVFIGDIDAIKCFRACGAQTFTAKDAASAAASLETAVKNGCRIIFILENVALTAWEQIEKYRGRAVAIIVIPDYRLSSDVFRRNIRRAIVEAVGADILSGD